MDIVVLGGGVNAEIQFGQKIFPRQDQRVKYANIAKGWLRMAEYIERAAVEKMAEQRLIDANKILYHQVWESGSMEPANEGVALMSEVQAMPTIDPEALPIVRQLREELERVTAERDAAIKELDEVTSEVDDLADFVDREIHPVIDYNLYLDLRENVDAVSMFQHEDEWRGLHKEE